MTPTPQDVRGGQGGVSSVISWSISMMINAHSKLEHTKKDKLEGNNVDNSEVKVVEFSNL